MLHTCFSSFLCINLLKQHYGLAKNFCSKIEVNNVISRSIIKPSSPTPHHLRTFKLSLLDRYAPPLYMVHVFFYPMRNDHPKAEHKLAVLKHSLSKTLTQFYPLAGRIKNRTSVVCNDEGALFMESHVDFQMLEFLKQPRIELLGNFLPLSPSWKQPWEETFQVAIKANVFACGGIALGICVHHTAMDGYALAVFLKQWAANAAAAAAIASGNNNIDNQLAYAQDMAASLFPLNESLLSKYPEWRTTPIHTVGKVCTRRFVIDAAAILTLKDKVRSEQVPNPSRTESILGLIWKSCLKASAALSGHCRGLSAMATPVNLRPRMKSPLPDHAIGNISGIAFAYCDKTSDDDADIELHSLVRKLRKSIEEIDGDYIEKMQGEQGHVEFYKRLKQVNEMDSSKGKSMFLASSLLSLGFYEVDFGWGKPLWVSSVNFTETVGNNFMFFMPAPHDNGVEVWLSLDENEMGIVGQDSELLSYASINPGIVSDI